MSRTNQKDFILGLSPDGPVKVDIETLLRTRGFIAASSGGGKSHTLRLIAERLNPIVQVIIMDPEGEYSTLRQKYPFVLIGPGGETPAHPQTAAQVALTLLKLGTSAVCDIYELKGNGRHEFVRNFIAAMVDAPKELWHPVVVIVDEAHVFCPENGYGESVAKDAIIDLCNLGRKRGFCPILATQRASKISKNAYEPLQNFFIGLTMPVDQKRVCDIFKVAPGTPTREFSQELETLDRGLFFVRGAAISKTKVLVQVDKTETKPPVTGSAAAARITPTPESIKHLLPTLKDIPAEAEKKVATEAQLRREIGELQKQVRTLSKETITPERERMLIQQLETVTKTAKGYEAVMGRIFAHSRTVIDAMNSIRKEIESIQSGAISISEAQKAAKEFIAAKKQEVHIIEGEDLAVMDFSNAPEGLTGPMRNILAALATFKSLGIDAPKRIHVCLFSGYSNTSSTGFAKGMSQLSSRGYISYPNSGTVTLTAAGIHITPVAPTPIGEDELHNRIRAILSGPEIKIFDHLLPHMTSAVSKEKLMEASGYSNQSSTGFAKALSHLSSMGFIYYPSPKMVALTELCFIST